MGHRGPTGRGASFNPPNRFEEITVGPPPEDVAQYFDMPQAAGKIPTRFFVDRSHTVLSKNDSPDIWFTYSVNPYRGCEHGCIYCYARPSHEYLGFSSGLDFETNIMVKPDVAVLLERQFQSHSWKPQVVAVSGNTDCYQPVEQKLCLTRRCLEVFLAFRNPLTITTKNSLVQRDLDLLKELASLNLVHVSISVTTLNPDLARRLEPRTSSPLKRLATIEALARDGISVGVNVAPVIPGLTLSEMPAILREAAQRGVHSAGYQVLRLPYAVKDLMVDWLKREVPLQASKVIRQIRDLGDGYLSCSEFGQRLKGSGPIADAIHRLFDMSCAQYHLNERRRELSVDHFRRNVRCQLSMF